MQIPEQAQAPRPSSMDFSQIKDIPRPDTTLSWKVPDGWSEEKGSGIRMVTFRSGGPDSVEVSIVSLGGPAGGLEPNVVRWAGQIGVAVDDVEAFIASQEQITTDNGLSGRIIDFTGLQQGGPDSAPSIIGAVFSLDQNSLFVKMTGSKAAVTAKKGKFRQLLQSLKAP